MADFTREDARRIATNLMVNSDNYEELHSAVFSIMCEFGYLYAELIGDHSFVGSDMQENLDANFDPESVVNRHVVLNRIK